MKKESFWREYFSIPNLMGYFRIVLAFVYLAICVRAQRAEDYYLAGAVIAVSMITDFLDGKIARRFDMVTDWGKILDPVSDKLTLGVVAFSFILRYPLAEKVVLLFLVKEGFMLIAGGLLMRRGWRTQGALYCGKVCTASMYVISVLLLLEPEMMTAKVNLLLLAELVIMLGTLAAYAELYFCAAQRLWSGADPASVSLKEIQKELKRKHRPYRRILTACIPLYFVYLVAGAVIPYTGQPEVSEETRKAFQPEDCYAENESSDPVSGSGQNEADGVRLDSASGNNDAVVQADSRTGIDRAGIIEDNADALDTRIQMIRHAKERVILSTFDFRTDEAGLDLLAVLLDAAERGVQVEIFADGFNSWIRMEGNPYFYALSSHPNAEITIYNKVNLLKPWTAMGRMHDKYVIVDETAYLLGGRNAFGYFLGDYKGHKNHDWDVLVYNTESSQAESEESSLYQVLEYYEEITAQKFCTVFHDRRSLAKSPSVRRARLELEQRLEKLQEKKPELFDSEYDYAGKTDPTGRITLLSNPIEYTVKEPVVFYQLMQLAQQAEGPVVIHTPYIMCSEMMYEEFAKLGDRATLMLNSAANNGNPFAAFDYLEHKQDLIDTGINILEYEGGISYHGKVMTIGEELSVVGSFNMDMRSAYLDTELMLVIDSPEVKRSLRTKMEEYEKQAALVESVDKYRSIPEGMEMKEISPSRKLIRSAFGWLLEELRFLL